MHIGIYAKSIPIKYCSCKIL